MTITFGAGVSSAVALAQQTLELTAQADRDGLDVFSVSDHPYVASRLDAYSLVGMALGRTDRIAGLVNVTNLPLRPAPMLARTVTSLTALSQGRLVLGMGAGGAWDEIVRLGVPRLEPAAAVRAFEEGIRLVRLLSGGGGPVTFDGEFYRVDGLRPAAATPAPVWTGSNGPRSLAVTGRVADGWIPGHAADWLSERYRTSRPIIDRAAEEAGRDPRQVRTVYNLPGVITPRPLAATRDHDGRWIGGSAGQWIEELTGAVLEHGASGFIYFAPDEAASKDAVAAWAREVVPGVRQAVGS
ncbi:LLM class flavin-dependent oxidoreductase [Nonomuraea soli]|uniref:Alkanesulfonate monooxygenase SsuD/methylene tetrahydromethanopterin reductase-like flavin-dependent oxidoreductase (Luciferase family) n=1 Tax=Nonomuraea soli TaxID=1032476 RepID=A0A7W0CHR0_9ACTN|nr:LLM class flavin-dependent oxidoreductase [Nonomuraea soli]MBA2891197.1 alkanesulfonate monooxygenase SsuD/methylene tetrahydromethanopterin reductase-like flavin-dependent oxidoreductase (luciferase family) [Nonomuraea soli]